MTKPRNPRPAGSPKRRRATSPLPAQNSAPALAPVAASPPSGGPPALGLSGVSWSWLAIGAFWLISYFNIPVPDQLAPVVLGLLVWSLIFLFYRLCQRHPVAGMLLGNF